MICIFAVIRGLLYPLAGTVIGSALVFFTKRNPTKRFMTVLDSLAGGIMCAASFFSLIRPAVEQSENHSVFSMLSCSAGFFSGLIVFILINKITEKVLSEKNKSGNMMFFAVTVHNIPEGMAVGVVFAGILTGREDVSIASALTLSLGIAMQNIPEGAIIALPQNMRGKSRQRAFLYGVFSGLAELFAGIVTLSAATLVYGILPFSLCFAAGAMFYVVLSELSEGFTDKKNSVVSLISFDSGFIIMMLLDTMLG